LDLLTIQAWIFDSWVKNLILVSSGTALIGVVPVVPDAVIHTSADPLGMLQQLILCVSDI